MRSSAIEAHTVYEKSGLLSLPAEVRTEIFGYVLEDVRCRRPLIVWENICTSISTHKPPISIAILLTCRTTYEDAISMLYDAATVEMTVRSDLPDESFPRFQVSLGSISQSRILHRLRHLELEISYDAQDSVAVARAARRISSLAGVFKEIDRLKTIDLIFFDQGRIMPSALTGEAISDSLLEACLDLECKKFLGISRNLPAKRKMSESKWEALRKKTGVHFETIEAFREINFDYWERMFRQKN